jgi:hypothetical protein
MTHSEAPISINLKTANGTQITLRASTPDEFTQLTSSIFEIKEAVDEVEKAVRSNDLSIPLSKPIDPTVGYISNAMGGTIVDTFTTPAPSAIVGARMCPHGNMTRIHGLTGKFGPYKGHFCPAKEGDPSKCANQYVKAGSPDFASFVADQTKA